ncbi:MAG TPA: tyrosine-type recombinase/integrase [Verrucomicrobiae bacterium]
MASLTKHPKSQYWSACFAGRDGRQMKWSTKTTDRAQALQIALELEAVERKAQAGSLTTMQLRKVLNDVSERVNGDTLLAPSVEDYLADWLKGIAARNSPATLERYGNTVKLFVKTLNGKAKKPVTAVTPKDVEDFLTSRLEGGVAPKTAIVDLKTLNTAFRRAEAFGTILKNPVSAIRPPKAESSERDVFTHEEVQKLLDAAPTLEWQTLIILGYFVGARLGDCVTMKWENVLPEQGVIVYHQQKTGKRVTVPMHFHVIEHFNYLSTFGTSGHLCPKLAAKGSGGKHGLSEGFKRIVIKAGIDPMVVQGKGTRNFTRRTFHSLRHTFNSTLANAGVPQEVRKELTGHSSDAMNQRYTHLKVESLKKAMKAMPLFGAKADTHEHADGAAAQALRAKE